MSRYRIGYLDDDKGQIQNFYQRLKNEFDLKILEINDISIPSDIINEIIKKDLQLIVLDFRLDSKGKYFNADELLREIKKWNTYFPVLILTIHETDAFYQLDDVNIINNKDVLENKTNIFILKINEIIKNYEYRKEMAVKRLEELVEKKETTGLIPAEEEEYFSTYHFLKNITPSEKILPSNLLTPESISSLHDLLVSTRKILSHLKEGK